MLPPARVRRLTHTRAAFRWLLQLSDACRCLSILSLRNCRKVTLHGEVSLSLLRVLDASGTGVTCDQLVAALRMCHTLEELVLDRCQALDRLGLRMGQLKVGCVVSKGLTGFGTEVPMPT